MGVYDQNQAGMKSPRIHDKRWIMNLKLFQLNSSINTTDLGVEIRF
jgi:hypothetical protein